MIKFFDIKKSLRKKLVCALLLTAILVIGFLVYFLYSDFSKINEEAHLRYAESKAQANSDILSDILNEYVKHLQDLAYLLDKFKNYPESEKQVLLQNMVRRLTELDGVTDAYASFERGDYFNERLTEPGKYYGIEAFRSLTGTTVLSVEQNEEINADDDWYHKARESGKPYLVEPYEWTYPSETVERQMFTISCPVIVNGVFIGALGLDMELSQIQNEVLAPMANDAEGSYVIFVSHEGTRAGHPKKELLFTPVGSELPPAEQSRLQQAIRRGDPYEVRQTNVSNNELSIYIYKPVKLKDNPNIPWSVGTTLSLTKLSESARASLRTAIIIAIVALVIWIAAFYALFGSVFSPVQRSSQLIRKIGDTRDLTLRTPVLSEDEIGEQNKSFNELMDEIQEAVSQTKKCANSLTGTSEELSSGSRHLKNSSSETVNQANAMASATEQMIMNINAMAGGAEQTSVNAGEVADSAELMSANMTTVAAAVEEMSVSISQIAANAGEARKVAADAATKSGEATDVMGELGTAAKEIGQVTDLIKKIADKTNLLALNATIEAASAGEAGKGFAVVAGEIKNLANQSAQSADDIARRIEGIQNGAEKAVRVIDDVSTIIQTINHAVEVIVGHVEQQTMASNEIASNVSQASTGAQRVAQSISEVAKSARDMSQNAGEAVKGAMNVQNNLQVFNQVANETSDSSKQMETVAADLIKISENLCKVVEDFKV